MEDEDKKLRRSSRIQNQKKKQKMENFSEELKKNLKKNKTILPPKFSFKKKNKPKKFNGIQNKKIKKNNFVNNFQKEDFVKDNFQKEDFVKDNFQKEDFVKDNFQKEDFVKDNFQKEDFPKVISQTSTSDQEGILFTLEPEKNIQENIKWNEWISATQTKNYILDDGFIDVINYNSTNIIKTDPGYEKDIGKMISLSTNAKGFVPSIMLSGNLFESKVYVLLKKELGEKNILDIGGNHNPRSNQKYEETIKAIQEGIPLIFQAVLRNYENKTYGIADILIRSDWINRFTDINSLNPDEISIPAKKLRGKYHYVVIDIKYKALTLRSDGVHLRNDSSLKAYKSQLWIYNEALSKIQGYCPPYSFILGSKWKYTSKNNMFEGNSCFNRLGRIDYAKLDLIYIEKTRKAIQWIRDVRENEYDLSKYPLSRDELYPNMCNRYDYPYHGIKKIFAEKNNDLTLLWNIGPKQRRIANENGVYKWSDPKCTPEIMGVKGKKRARVLSRILEANHSEEKNIYPKYVLNNFSDWKNEEGRKLELFVDFETTCSVLNDLEDLPLNTGETLIFLIGAGYIHPETQEWVYEKFVVDNINEIEENRICLNFIKFINELAIKFRIKNRIILWHYSHAECSSWKRFQDRNNKSFDVQWADLLKVFLDEPIGIKGALNYSLKTISKIFYQHGYIKTIWEGGDVENGADAAVGAYKANLESQKNNFSFQKHDLTKEIIKYNEVDCHVLQEILYYLRNNHIDPNKEISNNKKRKFDEIEN